MSDISSPQVRITWPPNDTHASFEGIDINIVSFDPAGLDAIEVTLTKPTFGNVADNERQPYVTATRTPGFEVFSNVHLVPQNRSWNRILARAKDKAGNFGYYDVRVTFPEPPPPDTSWQNMHGVNWAAQITKDETPKFMKICADNNWNLLRVDVYWQTYENDRVAFEARLRTIIEEAAKYRIQVIICNHQWHIGGAFVSDSAGFPARYVQGYAKPASPDEYQTSQLSATWWRDFWNRALKNGLDAWADMRVYWQALITIADGYSNVIGYEILNEPKSTAITDYDKIGAFNDFIGLHMRRFTAKRIGICRDEWIGTWRPVNSERHKMLPNINNIFYSAFGYRLSAIDLIIRDIKAVAGTLPVLVSEWATDPKYGTTIDLASSKLFNQKWKAAGFAHTYWAFGCWACQIGKKLVNQNGTLNPEGTFYSQAVRETYNV